ncbi:DUF2778 domain-containing protein [Burkholderia latens]|uniref:DUF2778 domain-containing protein n=1 Tax=Burkholderia latens TaxID=488446 RepID=A0A6H9SLB3_9BURK|nr:DUF2778 domain-containing protein [Burkholderia latens]KAB0634949.1 DUF2778 domain-containing protein [Burkholderia latens]
MHRCTFTLNDEPISIFEINGRKFPAFSGKSPYINKRDHQCLGNYGPIPTGTYYIVDRQSGGRLGRFKDAFSGKREWFALYADDGRIDDYTFCNSVTRGEFRLHPKSGTGTSKGCITLENQADFDIVRGMLLGGRGVIPGTEVRAYGKVTVR